MEKAKHLNIFDRFLSLWVMLAYGLNKISGEQHRIAGASALIGASNFFELAVATAITLFGFKSDAALATLDNFDSFRNRQIVIPI